VTAACSDLSRCPVCRARFRGAVRCGRCKADLAPLMRLQVDAYRLRGHARELLLAGDLDRAHRLAEAAEDRCSTAAGRRLVRLARWRAHVEPPPPPDVVARETAPEMAVVAGAEGSFGAERGGSGRARRAIAWVRRACSRVVARLRHG